MRISKTIQCSYEAWQKAETNFFSDDFKRQVKNLKNYYRFSFIINEQKDVDELRKRVKQQLLYKRGLYTFTPHYSSSQGRLRLYIGISENSLLIHPFTQHLRKEMLGGIEAQKESKKGYRTGSGAAQLFNEYLGKPMNIYFLPFPDDYDVFLLEKIEDFLQTCQYVEHEFRKQEAARARRRGLKAKRG